MAKRIDGEVEMAKRMRRVLDIKVCWILKLCGWYWGTGQGGGACGIRVIFQSYQLRQGLDENGTK